jgi:tetratricopeptide (TPR) repeat protein
MRKADFMLHLARAYIAEEEYQKTADLCENIIKTSNQPSRIMPALLMLSHAERKMTGYSRGYFSILRDVIEGFNHTESACVALYLLGRAHQERGDYDRAYSAYRDVVTRFPRSPEAAFASEKISLLQKHNPKIIAFLPDEAFLKSLDRINLPDFRNPEEEEPKKSFYAIMLGPVEEKADAMNIARVIKSEFAPVKIVQSAGFYAVYAGRLRDTKSATTMKIRLAEEMGYNGKIVKVRTEDNKTYIYGE